MGPFGAGPAGKIPRAGRNGGRPGLGWTKDRFWLGHGQSWGFRGLFGRSIGFGPLLFVRGREWAGLARFGVRGSQRRLCGGFAEVFGGIGGAGWLFVTKVNFPRLERKTQVVT